MHEHIRELIQSQGMCVLATARDNTPHTSLMAYAVSRDCQTFFMATLRDTTKFSNIQANPNVCLLLDNRRDHPEHDRLATRALTVHGRAVIVQDPVSRKNCIAMIGARHPHLRDFLGRDQIQCIRVMADNYLLLQGPVSSIYEEREAMSDIVIETDPAQNRLDELGVRSWPIWSKEASEFPWTYDERETCYLLEGDVAVTTDGGETVHIKAGDLVIFPKGMSCTWKITKDVRKHYQFG